MENKFMKFFLWFALIIFYVFLSASLGMIIRSMHIKNDLVLNIAYIVGELVITAILVLLYKNDFKNKFKELKSDKGNEMIKTSIKFWLIGLFFMILFNMFLSFIVGGIAQNESTNRDIISNNSIYAIVTMIILTPICEEIIFRLSPSKMIDNKYLYIIFSGVMFGFVHVIGATGLQSLYILPYASLGLAFASIYDKNKNILCSILMHSIHNMICILLIFLI